jgi:hypothetical protein
MQSKLVEGIIPMSFRSFFSLYSSRESEDLNMVTNFKDAAFYTRACMKDMRVLFSLRSAPDVADDKSSLTTSHDLER